MTKDSPGAYSTPVALTSIILDREVQFIAGMMNKLNKLLEIQTKLLTAYHPQTDRQIEKINQELE